jgi:3D (Asp-Asp-Asp) domain-containing protein
VKLIAILVMVFSLLSITLRYGLAQEIQRVHVTSYRATVAECGSSRGITASGVKCTKGVVATDWKVYPPGTILHCKNTNEIWVAADTGGAIHGHRIDRFVKKWKPGMYQEGKLKVAVLYKPKYKDATPKAAVNRGLYLRNRLIRSNVNLTSRGGYEARKYIASLIVKKSQTPKIEKKKPVRACNKK